ncbi:hypothetical protein GCM10010201_25500 [Pilimelia columellifera subsp. columellifera]|uniref:Uncharacterized protein n=1 Tax=Pilimelia columellifera subsp. columellifera TaxID=706583 RepID=A0ABN3NLZ5_9ACTN
MGLATAVAPAHGAPAHPAADAPRAMWVWSQAAPADIVGWAGRRGVQDIFAHVAPDFATNGDLPRLRELGRRSGAAGIRLWALGGDPGWAFDHATAAQWRQDTQATGLFHGSHIDVEPYALAAWDAGRVATVAAFLELLDQLRAVDPAPLEADVPFWYGEVAAGESTLADEVLARVDGVTAMTYRDTASGPNSMTDVAADILDRGAAAGRPVRLAAETDRLPDCPYCTFHEEGLRAMDRTLAEVDAVVAGRPAYAGMAIHHYDSWRALRR